MITITISGICGRMGRMIVDCASEDKEVCVVSGIESSGHPSVGKDLSDVFGIDSIKGNLGDSLDTVKEVGDVIIDFSNHEGTAALMESAGNMQKAIVIGTTGFSIEEEDKISELSKNMRCVKSPNMSVGVNILFKLTEQAVKAVGESYDIEIVEAHHRFKKDAPSGTAKKILEIAAEASGKNSHKDTTYGREGLIGERPSSEIGVFAIRGGDIIGEHTVMLAGIGERIELTHRAHTRSPLARGALRAAKFIVNQKNGLYDMQDVLGLK